MADGEDSEAMRCVRTSVLVSAAALLALSACVDSFRNQPPPPGSWPAPPAAAAVTPPPPAPPAFTLDIPVGIAGDTEAERFQALRGLVDAGIVAPAEADPRRAANLGALLPFDQPPPAAGLDQPLPLADLTNRVAQLSGPTAPPNQAAERDLLLDRLLPLAPRQRAAPARRDAEAARLGRARIETLAAAGLVSPDEKEREIKAIDQVDQALAMAPPPAPPPPASTRKKKSPRAKPAAVETGQKVGDIPGGAIPASGKGPVGVHLLSMASPTTTDKAVEALKKENPELASLSFKAVKTVIPDLGTTYRLLAGPLAPAEAETLCRTLRTRGQSCAVSGFEDR
ncbi:SPOR domain-containing protein [Magnetospirillum fulvum]|uniref:Sporulation related domain-containing protein n=1 Tax=Magnetospirillum fulvum TaxID=1082 RepID=A0A1H6HKZ8_MAGFU|nr:SPOR domain-containing protein [Magnetospirillum fulvum]SEH34904.1 Sporulation related domain-containing protein [Magnetospirillum fulvum]